MSQPHQESYSGSCFCGSISFAVTGKSLKSAYCHCTLCQRLTGTQTIYREPITLTQSCDFYAASAFIHTMHFPASSFRWTHAEPHDAAMDFYDVAGRPWKRRSRCKICGAQVASYNSKKDSWSVWGSTLKRDEAGKIIGWENVKPTDHIFYGTRILDINDGLPKWEGYDHQSARIG